MKETEFPATSVPLFAASWLLEGHCQDVNDNFMRCKQENDDPETCEQEAKNVMECTKNMFDRLAASRCQPLFENFWKCLDMNNQDLIYCRSEEREFFQCTKNVLKLEKRLWIGPSSALGYKAEGERPEDGSVRYKLHVLRHKK